MIPRRAPDPEPVPQCGATFNEHRCTLDKDHEGWHQEWVERLVDTATWQDAPEVPEWRALVDEYAAEDVPPQMAALSYVLHDLAEVERGTDPRYALARIVARCEREIGDGWQADPSGWVATPALHALLRCVAGVPTGPGTAWPETDWQGLANAASAWLRDLTDASAWLRDITEDGATTPGCPACDGVAGTTCRCPEPDPVPETECCGAERSNGHIHRCACKCIPQVDWWRDGVVDDDMTDKDGEDYS